MLKHSNHLSSLGVAPKFKPYDSATMKKTDGQAEGVLAMLNAFEKQYTLSEKDLLLLQGMLLYPEKFLRLINEYYNRRRACISPAMEERLQAAAQDHSGLKLKRILSSL